MTAINVADGPCLIPSAGAGDTPGVATDIRSVASLPAALEWAATSGTSAVPQPRQNLLSAGLMCRHRGQVTPGTGCGTVEPQARQNFASRRSSAPQ